jgi:hypothetical protein
MNSTFPGSLMACILISSNVAVSSTRSSANSSAPSTEVNDEQPLLSHLGSLASSDLPISASQEEDEEEHDHDMKSVTVGSSIECANHWYTALGVGEPRRRISRCQPGKRQVRFKEIATVHVYQPQLPPTIPPLFQPALQKTEFSYLPVMFHCVVKGDHGAATVRATFHGEKFNRIGCEQQELIIVDRSMTKKSSTAQKKCTPIAA